MKKLLVFDLDGTLLNGEGKVSKKMSNFLSSLKAQDYGIAIATGRCLVSALSATDGAPFASYIVTDSGCGIYNTINMLPIYEKTVKIPDIEKILDRFDDTCRFIDLCNKDFIYKLSYEEPTNDFTRQSTDREYILNNAKNVTHVTLRMKYNDVEELKAELEKELPNLNIAIMQDSFCDDRWLEISYKDITKYNTVSLLSEALQLTNDDIIAFGDALNDIEMLSESGVGVAMENALPEVKEVANYITLKSNEEDGIIDFLKVYLNIE